MVLELIKQCYGFLCVNKQNDKGTVFDMELMNHFYSISDTPSNGEMFTHDNLEVSCP